MNTEKFLVGIVLIFFLDTVLTIGNYITRFTKIRIANQRKIWDDFPTWSGTKKPIIWFVIWAIAIYLNLAVYTLFSWLIIKRGGDPNDGWVYMTAVLVFAFAGYLILLGIIYAIVKGVIKKRKTND